MLAKCCDHQQENCQECGLDFTAWNAEQRERDIRFKALRERAKAAQEAHAVLNAPTMGVRRSSSGLISSTGEMIKKLPIGTRIAFVGSTRELVGVIQQHCMEDPMGFGKKLPCYRVRFLDGKRDTILVEDVYNEWKVVS